ncbi:aromatic ring-hydroxylating dioxygenase subunit alpha [Picosynechococcus sp. PCC 8807]|uniref:aromatic ring-hydroxylating dioxygenase subunit alpha n=1 Tax=Picosynechococcus sp. PCC 8807 TaxID=195248 RepID=UPI000810EDA6|nr:Rieske 2Fe-2S domain-containing protein [Picosynechococcus sp. PCC 8807]ANV91521.1 cell death suppressor protein Lls1 [Picosynechococcus sp. PCC 8807]
MVATPLPEPTADTTPAFDWHAAWYPIHFVQDLDKTKPTRFVLLGDPLVIWWQPKTQQWQVFSDVCPHRLAPLSEGRIVDGCLECPYHGWQFAETGACTKIPFQAPGGEAHHSPRAQVKTYASCVKQGLLFVYGGDRHEAAQTPIPTVPQLDQHPGEWVMADVFRDIPYDATTLLENVLDTSHVAFTHHPRVGNRKNAKEFILDVSEVEKTGFTGNWEEGPRRGTLGSQKTTFFAPAAMWHDIPESPFGQVMTVVYATPTEKGRCRAIVRLPFRFKAAIPRLAFKFTPRWFSHLNQMGILEDDQIFLHLQERELAKSTQNYAKTCYLPTSSDSFVLAYRQWVERYGEPFPDEDFSPAEPQQSQLLERYHSHTKNCASCTQALHRIQKGKKGVIGLGFLLWLGLPFAIFSGLPTWSLGAIATVIIVLAGLWWQLHRLERRFFEGEYPPTRNHQK